ncbi:MAG: B12-binding domain-containing radical SAM protein [Acidobacteria bacterium]|nr:B12-binding domain-containing radical SAM protein [Acidobacteriota bacterium]
MKLGIIVVIDDSMPPRRFMQTMCPPLGVLSLQAYLAERSPDVDLCWDYDPAKILARQPDIIGLSAVTENFIALQNLLPRLRAHTTAPLILGGTHISLRPDLLPDEAALGVIGEGEETLRELLLLFARYGTLAPKRLSRVAGIVFRHPRRGVQVTPPRAPVRPLDRIPFPHRRILDPPDCIHLLTSRGCPYRCAFCSSPALWTSFRQYSADAVIAELIRLKADLDPPLIKFMDDLFVADRRRVRQIAAGLSDRGISFRQGYSAFARPNLLDEDLVGRLRRMGVVRLSLGIESGAQSILDRLDKRSSVALNQKALDLCARHGIRTCCSFVIGVPGETAAELTATLQFIERNRGSIHEIEICPLVPFPGTPLWDEALRQGRVHRNMDWSRLRDHSDFGQFEPETYLYLNPAMPRETFTDFCLRFKDVYREISRIRTLAVSFPSPAPSDPSPAPPGPASLLR